MGAGASTARGFVPVQDEVEARPGKGRGVDRLRIDVNSRAGTNKISAGRTPAHKNANKELLSISFVSHSFGEEVGGETPRSERDFEHGPDPTQTTPLLSPATRVRTRTSRRASLAVQATLAAISAVEVVAEAQPKPQVDSRAPSAASSIFDAKLGTRQSGSSFAMSKLSALQSQWAALDEDEKTEEIMIHIVETLLKGGEPLMAFDLLNSATEAFKLRRKACNEATLLNPKVAKCRARVLMAVGSMAEAVIVLNSLFDSGERSEVLLSLLGKAQKSIAAILPADGDARSTAYERSEAFYNMCFIAAKTRGDDGAAFYNGINVAHAALMSGNPTRAVAVANEVVHFCERAALGGLDAIPSKRRQNMWLEATLGEAFVILGDVKKACARYSEAIACEPGNFASHHTFWVQAELTAREVGLGGAALAMLREPFLVARPSVAICCGDPLTEGDERGEERVRETVQHFFDSLGTSCRGCFASGAPGSTLLFLEEATRRKIDCTIILPCPVEDYVQSVQARRLYEGCSDERWAMRFRRVVANATKVYHAGSVGALHNPCACEYAHTVMAGLAQLKANELGGRLVPVAMLGKMGSRNSLTLVDEVRVRRGSGVGSALSSGSAGGSAAGEAGVMHIPPQVRAPSRAIIEMWHGHGWETEQLAVPAQRETRRNSGLLASTIQTLPAMLEFGDDDEGSEVEDEERGGVAAAGESLSPRSAAVAAAERKLLEISTPSGEPTASPAPVSKILKLSTARVLDNGDTAKHMPNVGFLFADAVGFSKLKEVHMVSFIDHFMGAVSALGAFVYAFARACVCVCPGASARDRLDSTRAVLSYPARWVHTMLATFLRSTLTRSSFVWPTTTHDVVRRSRCNGRSGPAHCAQHVGRWYLHVLHERTRVRPVCSPPLHGRGVRKLGIVGPPGEHEHSRWGSRRACDPTR